MATRTTIECDRCGSTGGVNWWEDVTPAKLLCPPDGVNCGNYSCDLCRDCRVALERLLVEFTKKQPEGVGR